MIWESRLRILRMVTVGLSVLWCILILVVFMMRVAFPLELEWMEGGILHQALRMQQGQVTYGPPNRDFVPFLYPPLYPALVAFFGSIFPLDYTVARMISISAVLAVAWGLWHLVAREGKPRTHRFLAIGLFLSGYIFSYRWLDVGRADSLFLALLLWGLICLRESWGRWTRALWAGVLVSLAFWAKQTAFVFILVSGFSVFLVAPAQIWIYGITVSILAGVGVVIGNWFSQGWLWTYIFEIHQSHAFNWQRFTHKSWEMFAHALPFVLILLMAWLVQSILPLFRETRRLGEEWFIRCLARIRASRGTVYWGIWCVVGLVVSALGYSTQWAEANAFIPGTCFLAAFVAVALPVGGLRECWALALTSGQLLFALLFETNYQIIWDKGYSQLLESYELQNIWRTIPRNIVRQEAKSLRDSIEQKTGFRNRLWSKQHGEIFALHRPWWSVLAGGRGHVGSMGLNDIGSEFNLPIIKELRKSLNDGEFSSVIVEGKLPKWMIGAMVDSYRLDQRLSGKDRVLPLVGYMSRAGMSSAYRGRQLFFVELSGTPVRKASRVIADFEDGTLQGFKTEGDAFGRAPSRSLSMTLPPIGPHGGKFLLSSAIGKRGVRGIGIARSPNFQIGDEDEALELMIGSSRHSPDLSVRVIASRSSNDQDFGNSRVRDSATLTIQATSWRLETLRWSIPLNWKGSTVFIELRDDATDAAVFVDEVYLIASEKSP